MRARIHILSSLLAASAFGAAAVLVACASETAPRETFELTPEAGSVANLPDASVPTDAAPKDAGDTRPKFDPADEPVTCAGGPCAVEIAAGDHHFCARMSDGTVRCWGSDEFGALGAGTPRDPKDPPPKDAPDAGAKDVDAGAPSAAKLVAGLTDATQISAAGTTTCARRKDGSVWCWGGNTMGQLGLSDRATFDYSPHPDAGPVALRSPAVRVDVGPGNACAVLTTGEVWCWGTNEKLQLARPDAEAAYVLGTGAAKLAPYAVARTTFGTNTGLGLTATGELVSWGAVSGKDGMVSGRLSSVSPDPSPFGVAQLASVSSYAVTSSLTKGEGGPIGEPTLIGPFPPPGGLQRHAHACAIANGQVYCWGRSDTGALCTGLPDAEILPAPAPVRSAKAWPQQVAVADEISCVRLTDGTVQCCGGDAKGRLGPNHPEPFVPFFEPVTSYTSHAVQVAASMRSVCALAVTGAVECWGGNEFGELGLLTTDDEAHPTPVKVAF